MSWTPVETALGRLEIVEVYVEFDGPRVFAARSRADQLFLAGWAAEGEAADTWLYVPISSARLRAITSGSLPLIDGYLHPEERLYSVQLPHRGGPDTVTSLDPQEIDPAWLPSDDYFLHVEGPLATAVSAEAEPLARMKSAEQLLQVAIGERRPRMRIEVPSPAGRPHEAPARILGPLIATSQQFFDITAANLLRSASEPAGRIPRWVTDQVDTNVVALEAASVVVEFACNEPDSLFDESTFVEVTGLLHQALAPRQSTADLRDAIAPLGPRGIAVLKRLVDRVARFGGAVAVSSASRQRGFAVAEMSANDLSRLREQLKVVAKARTYEIRGHMLLVAFDDERKTAGLDDTLAGQRYDCKIGERAVKQITQVSLPAVYDALITEYDELDEVSGRTRVSYFLEQLIPVEDGAVTVVVTRVPLNVDDDSDFDPADSGLDILEE